jgi:hypothetical protein
MNFGCSRLCLGACIALTAALYAQAPAQSSPPSSASSSASHAREPASSSTTGLDPGSVSNGIYRNKTFGFTCKIPAGWVLRTEEMNAQDDDRAQPPNPGGKAHPPKVQTDKSSPVSGQSSGKVLLGAFSRPPEARGEEVNSSIVIAAESVAAYPGLKEAGQYFQPLTEVATAQGFTVDEEPYEIAIGNKTLAREDFHKDVGTRVMRQSTMAILAHGYAVSFTVIAGTEDDVEELIDGLDFQASGK